MKFNDLNIKNIISTIKKKKKNSFYNKKYFYPLMLSTYSTEEVNQAIESMINFRTTMSVKTEKFEKKFSHFLKNKYSVMVNSGSSADLLITFSIIDKFYGILKKNDEILIPVLTWPTHIWSAMMAGFKVKLVDIDPATLNVDMNILEKNISKKTKAIFLVHALGNPCNMDKILNIVKKHNLILLEDCCEALGSKFNNKFVGTFGSAASFSFFFGHHLNTMEGGMVTTNSSKIMKNLKVIRAHGWTRNISKKKYHNFHQRYKFVNWGFNVRPTELQAGFGIEQLKKIYIFNKIRSKFFNKFYNSFKESKYIYFPKVEKKSEPAWFAIPIILNDNAPFSRSDIISYLEKNGIETRPIIVGNIARHPVNKVFNFLNKKKYSGADYIHTNGFYIGLSPAVSNYSFDKLIKIFDNFMGLYK
jgi:CDP-6-deoxy-D-xylo-4-hexulose-3-dehydrase